MQVLLDISESDLAHVWADATWDGKHPQPLAQILAGIIQTAAAKHRNFLRDHAAETGQDYNALHEQCVDRFLTTCH